MSSIIPPLLSSSPPPMVSTIILDDDDDDEFGNFTRATDLHCDTDVLSPTEVFTQINGIDDELDRRKNFSDEIKNQDCNTKYNSFQYFPEIPPDLTPETCDLDTTEEDDKEISEILDNEISTCTIKQDVDIIPNSEDVVALADLENSFADFHSFADQEVHEIVEKTSDLPTSDDPTSLENFEVENDDDFGDFNDYSLQSNTVDYSVQPNDTANLSLDVNDVVNIMFPSCENLTEDYIEENFDSSNNIFVHLKDITDTSALTYQWSKSNSQHFLLQALNIDTRNILYGPRWNESMPRYAATLGFAPLEPVKSDNVANVEITQDLVQQTDIPSAEFDWVGSGLTNPLENSPASTMLLDLEQLVATLDIQYSSSHSPKSHNSPSNVDDLDDWEFWLRLTPTKIPEKQHSADEIEHTMEKISQSQLHTSDDNDSINSLKLSDKRDDDFDDFHCFQSNKVDEHDYDNWPMSLRETHISNVKVEEPGWLKPTILTPDLPRKKMECEEEFANFQSGNFDILHDTKISTVQEPIPQVNESLPPSNPKMTVFDVLEPAISSKLQTSPIIAQTSNVPTLESPICITQEPTKINDEDDEFTEFQSTTFAPAQPVPAILEPLQPSILQPVKVENTSSLPTSTAINWPDPGITDEDLQRFNLYKPSLNENVTKDVKHVDDDDWTDFISNQTTQLNNLQINKPVQNGFQTSLVSNQYVVLASKPDEIEDEWSDFVSSQPPPAPQAVSRPPRSSLPKLNLDWNAPPQFSSWTTNITPNIITNPASFESFQSYTTFDTDLLKNRITNKKTPNIMIQPKKSTVPSISSIPDLEFIAPKNRTWKK